MSWHLIIVVFCDNVILVVQTTFVIHDRTVLVTVAAEDFPEGAKMQHCGCQTCEMM